MKLPRFQDLNTFGYCERCGVVHSLPVGDALKHAFILMDKFEEDKRIDFDVSVESCSPKFPTELLWSEKRGKMFGVLVGVDKNGKEVVLKAFSCQYFREWLCDGWVAPLVDVELYLKRCSEEDVFIKSISKKLDDLDKDDLEYVNLLEKRKKLSQNLMRELKEMYKFHNFNGDMKTLFDVWSRDGGIPAGVGDCCAPKLLNAAILEGITPTGLVEFYWGKENRSKTRQHKQFYPVCEQKCQPILGFMLCGLEK